LSQSSFDLKRKLLQLEALYDAGRSINTLRPEGELLEELMHRAVAVLDASIGFAFTLDEDLQYQHGFLFGIDGQVPPETLLAEEPVRRLLVSRTAVSIALPAFLGQPAGSLVITPMISGDVLVGAIGVGGKEERGTKGGSFVEDDLRFLDSLSSIGAAAVENARRFHKLNLVRQSLEDENRSLKRRMHREYSDRLMVGDSPKMQRVVDLIARVADSPASVLIRGESGTGKEMVARLLHGNSPRRDKPVPRPSWNRSCSVLRGEWPPVWRPGRGVSKRPREAPFSSMRSATSP
jgi:hypothetical protein